VPSLPCRNGHYSLELVFSFRFRFRFLFPLDPLLLTEWKMHVIKNNGGSMEQGLKMLFVAIEYRKADISPPVPSYPTSPPSLSMWENSTDNFDFHLLWPLEF